jgi:hypothetical protein
MTSVGSTTSNGSGLLFAELLGHLSADEHRVRLAAEVLEHAELVVDLRAARDQHEWVLDLAEQLARALPAPVREQEARVRRKELATPTVEAMRAMYGAECVPRRTARFRR